MILEALALSKTFYTGGLGVNAKRLLLPLVAPDVATVNIDVHTEIDVDGGGNGTPNARNLAMSQLAEPAAGSIALGLSLARPGPGLDARYLPPVRDHEVPILHSFTRKISDGTKGVRQLSYAYRATLWTLEEFKQDTQQAQRIIGDAQSGKVLMLVRVHDIVPVPAYTALEDTVLALAFVVVWQTRDSKPRGV